MSESPIPTPMRSVQAGSDGWSPPSITEAALRAARPEAAVDWMDIGTGRGAAIQTIIQSWKPRSIVAVDLLDFLDDELKSQVDFHVGPAEEVLSRVEPVDRVLMIETVEHLEAPWLVLRLAARLVRPGGCLVVTFPNVANLRSRLHLMAHGHLSLFHPEHEAHLTPILPHVVQRILREEGLIVDPKSHAGADIIPLTGGRIAPAIAQRRFPSLTSVSTVVAATRPVAENSD